MKRNKTRIPLDATYLGEKAYDWAFIGLTAPPRRSWRGLAKAKLHIRKPRWLALLPHNVKVGNLNLNTTQIQGTLLRVTWKWIWDRQKQQRFCSCSVLLVFSFHSASFRYCDPRNTTFRSAIAWQKYSTSENPLKCISYYAQLYFYGELMRFPRRAWKQNVRYKTRTRVTLSVVLGKQNERLCPDTHVIWDSSRC